MCGICGFWTRDGDVVRDGRDVLRQMSSEMQQRGPDAAGTWLDEDAGLGFGHRRLSIIDLSIGGRQPMVSADKRWVLTYNGEVYNFVDLRDRLGGGLRGGSDTEVVLESIARFGVEQTVRRCNGMFAFAAWDRERRELHLVRDRLGIKPLYWGRVDAAVLFASQLSPFRRYPSFAPEVDRDALSAYLRYDAVPGERCILQGFHKLPPGHIATFGDRDAEPDVRPYWNAATLRTEMFRDPFDGSTDEAVDTLEELLREAVGARMIADVPLGAFLSGGVDSSTVVALMQAQSNQPVRTFSIGFHDEAYDEAVDARAVAEHLGTDHTELYVEPDDALDVIPGLAAMYDEPFADSSQIPTHLVSALARQHVTVALSGDGGDELFAGYNRHLWGPRVWGATGRIPRPLRQAVAGGLLAVSSERWEQVFERLEPLLPDALHVRLPADKLQKLAGVLPAESAAALYLHLASMWKDPAEIVVGGTDGVVELPEFDGPLAEQMMLWDLVSYLPDDILTKVDRASMAVSLEARVPLLDHRVVEFAWSLPLDLKLRDGQSKWALRQVLYRHVPRELIERPKMGFGVPIDRWLRGPLRDWARSLLDGVDGTYLHAEPIRERWDEHLDGARNWQHHLWDILMFQAWRTDWGL